MTAPRRGWRDSDVPRGLAYDERFAQLAATGRDVHGEANFLSSLGPASVLDAGCGTGRIALELARRGQDVVGVDVDESMLEVARGQRPDLPWVGADLVDVHLGRTFDLVVMAGNVMIFLDPGTEGEVLANMTGHLRPGGLLVSGFTLVPGGLTLESYDALATRCSLEPVERWSTWDRHPFVAGSDYAVSVHRRALPARSSTPGP
jgi:SAM-dependent methyltransferase